MPREELRQRVESPSTEALSAGRTSTEPRPVALDATALTRAGSHGGQANVAVVPVPDPRLGVLTEMERSKKTVPAQVRFVDVPGGTSSAEFRKMIDADIEKFAAVAKAANLKFGE